jgi:hypothetical protein
LLLLMLLSASLLPVLRPSLLLLLPALLPALLLLLLSAPLLPLPLPLPLPLLLLPGCSTWPTRSHRMTACV